MINEAIYIKLLFYLLALFWLVIFLIFPPRWAKKIIYGESDEKKSEDQQPIITDNRERESSSLESQVSTEKKLTNHVFFMLV